MSTIVRTGATLARGKSKQDYGTPPEFLNAVERRFGAIGFDLAATHANCVCGPERCFTPQQNSLAMDWTIWTMKRGLLWLNPPYADIAPWAKKCAESAGPFTHILMLVPASVGSEWFAEHVEPHALVYALRPRLRFVGQKDVYPKDLILCAYGFGVRGFASWRWTGAKRRQTE